MKVSPANIPPNSKSQIPERPKSHQHRQNSQKLVAIPAISINVCLFLTYKEKLALQAVCKSLFASVNRHFNSLINKRRNSGKNLHSESLTSLYDPRLNYSVLYRNIYLRQIITLVHDPATSFNHTKIRLAPASILFEADSLSNLQASKEFLLAKSTSSEGSKQHVVLQLDSLVNPKKDQSTYIHEELKVIETSESTNLKGEMDIRAVSDLCLFSKHFLTISDKGSLICTFFSDTKQELLGEKTSALCFNLRPSEENSCYERLWSSYEFALVAYKQSSRLAVIDMRELLRTTQADLEPREKIYRCFKEKYMRPVNEIPEGVRVIKACVGMSRAFIIDGANKLWQIDLLADKPSLEENLQMKGHSFEDVGYSNGYFYFTRTMQSKKCIQDWTTEDVGNWAKSLGLDEQIQRALRNWKIKGRDLINSANLWTHELGIKKKELLNLIHGSIDWNLERGGLKELKGYLLKDPYFKKRRFSDQEDFLSVKKEQIIKNLDLPKNVKEGKEKPIRFIHNKDTIYLLTSGSRIYVQCHTGFKGVAASDLLIPMGKNIGSWTNISDSIRKSSTSFSHYQIEDIALKNGEILLAVNFQGDSKAVQIESKAHKHPFIEALADEKREKNISKHKKSLESPVLPKDSYMEMTHLVTKNGLKFKKSVPRKQTLI